MGELNVVFINYGAFNSNSGGHVANFANALARQGVKVAAVGGNDPATARDFGPPQFECFTFAQLKNGIPPSLDALLRSPGTVVQAWTPRENVRALTERLAGQYDRPYVVHLEDNEEIVTSSQVGVPWPELIKRPTDVLDRQIPEHLSHPTRYRTFLEEAAGATVIVDRLTEFVPARLATHVLEPGVDIDIFAPNLSEIERTGRRADMYIPPESKVLVYHGNMHAANRHEIFSLYTAVMILRRRGHRVSLIRTGMDYSDDLDVSMEYLRRDVITLGYLERAELINTLKLADFYVQPGAIDAFNAFRLPSKIPEFLALGRPVLLPRTNIGLALKDGAEAILLDRGDGGEIADKIERLIVDPDRAETIGAAGRAFAARNLNWDVNAAKLASFYRSIVI